MHSTEDARRLFFALWPDAAIRGEIVRRQSVLDTAGRRVPDHNLHLTLLFLGNQPADNLPVIIQNAGKIGGEAFELTLDHFGWFARARVAWLGGQPPEAGQALVAGLEAAMSGSEVKFDRRPWRPHVTLFRKVARKPEFPEFPPLAWPVREFALVESVPGQPYRVLDAWQCPPGT